LIGTWIFEALLAWYASGQADAFGCEQMEWQKVQNVNDKILSFGPFELNRGQQRLTKRGIPLQLGGRALDLLFALAEQSGEVVSKSDLMARAWPNMVVEEANLRMQIALLRKALGDQSDGAHYVVNVPGRGYRLDIPLDTSYAILAPNGARARINATGLPRRVSRVFGRSETVTGLAAHLASNRFVTILGPGGIGKTTVALKLAETVASAFVDGVHYVDFSPLRQAGMVPSAMASALGLPVTSVDPTPNILAFLRDKSALLVLDTCEHVLGGAAVLVEALLTHASGIAILTTSREPLRADGEFRYRLQSLDVAPSTHGILAAEASCYPAIELFVDRARSTLHDFQLDDTNASAVVELCSRLDGLPLAIELAAARADDFGVRGMLDRLADRFLLLNEGRRTALPRQQTLRATCDWSYDLLTPFEQRAFRAIGLFQGKFSLEAVEAILADDGTSKADIFNTVRMLELKSLVLVDMGDTGTLFYLLDSLRAYAIDKLHTHGEVELVSSQYGEYLAELLGSSEEVLATGARAEWVAAHSHLLDDLRNLRLWALSSQHTADLYFRIVDASIPLYWELALLDEQRDVLIGALNVLPSALEGTPVEMRFQSALAFSMFYTQGLLPRVYHAFARGLAIATDVGDTAFKLRTLWGLFGASKVAGVYDEALNFAEQYQNIVAAEATGDRPVSVGNRMMAMSLHYLGGHAEAESFLNVVIRDSMSNKVDSRAAFQYDDQVTAKAMLARVRWIQGFPEQAARIAEDSVCEALALKHEISLCFVLAFGACSVSLWRDDIQRAGWQIAMLNTHAFQNSFQYWLSWGKCYQAALETRSDDFPVTAIHNDLARLAPTSLHVDILSTLGSPFVGDKALERLSLSHISWSTCEVLRVKAERLSVTDHAILEEEPERLLRQSLSIARQQGALAWELRSAMSLARLWRQSGRRPEAYELLSHVHGRFTEGFETGDLKAARSLLLELRSERQTVRKDRIGSPSI
jgi:predicted ATPase/DNA-binding winged helix-turn-helix (wHTH) protein